MHTDYGEASQQVDKSDKTKTALSDGFLR